MKPLPRSKCCGAIGQSEPSMSRSAPNSSRARSAASAKSPLPLVASPETFATTFGHAAISASCERHTGIVSASPSGGLPRWSSTTVRPGWRCATRTTCSMWRPNASGTSSGRPAAASSSSERPTSGRSRKPGSGSSCTRWRTPTRRSVRAGSASAARTASGSASGSQPTTSARMIPPAASSVRAVRPRWAVSAAVSSACTRITRVTPSATSGARTSSGSTVRRSGAGAPASHA